jgi:hypothetical protein
MAETSGLLMLPNQYLYYSYYREQAVANIQASGSTRGEQILGINDPLCSPQAVRSRLNLHEPFKSSCQYFRRCPQLQRHDQFKSRWHGVIVMLVWPIAAMNPYPCGPYDNPRRACTCAAGVNVATRSGSVARC